MAPNKNATSPKDKSRRLDPRLSKDFLRHLATQPNLLRQIPSFFSDVLDALPAAIYHSSYDPKTKRWTIRYVSQGIERLLGYKASELENKRSFMELVMTNLHYYQLFEEVLTPNNARFRLTFEFRDTKGNGKWCSDDGIILFDQNGQVRGSVGVFVDITDHKEMEKTIQEENLRLKTALRTPARLGGMVGRSQGMQDVFSRILKMALSTTNLVVIGESGTGKELAARAIHDLSNRSAQNFIAVNCSSISENLFESEFFGHKKGSFTGAVDNRQGYLDSANGGTLFLDEVGEIPLHIQTKLLRVLDGYGYIPVGENKVRYSDFRLIAATNRNLDLLIRKGLMREDFYYRINAITLHMPPLRKRREDIPLLINYFLARQNLTFEALPPEFFKRLLNYAWPGNIRELQNVLSRYIAFQETELHHDNSQDLRQVLPDFAPADDLPDSPPRPRMPSRPEANMGSDWGQGPSKGFAVDGKRPAYESYQDFERQRILAALNEQGWRVDAAAAQLGRSRSSLYRQMKKYGLSKK